jgi:hypothetical protein
LRHRRGEPVLDQCFRVDALRQFAQRGDCLADQLVRPVQRAVSRYRTGAGHVEQQHGAEQLLLRAVVQVALDTVPLVERRLRQLARGDVRGRGRVGDRQSRDVERDIDHSTLFGKGLVVLDDRDHRSVPVHPGQCPPWRRPRCHGPAVHVEERAAIVGVVQDERRIADRVGQRALQHDRRCLVWFAGLSEHGPRRLRARQLQVQSAGRDREGHRADEQGAGHEQRHGTTARGGPERGDQRGRDPAEPGHQNRAPLRGAVPAPEAAGRDPAAEDHGQRRDGHDHIGHAARHGCRGGRPRIVVPPPRRRR